MRPTTNAVAVAGPESGSSSGPQQLQHSLYLVRGRWLDLSKRVAQVHTALADRHMKQQLAAAGGATASGPTWQVRGGVGSGCTCSLLVSGRCSRQ